MRVTHFVGLTAVAACAASPGRTPLSNEAPSVALASACALPKDFLLYDMALADLTLKPMPVPAEVRVLAWQRTVDKRPLYIDSALLWIHARDGRYMLANLYRHPRDPSDRAWHRYLGAATNHSGYLGITAHPPTHAELEAYLGETNWSWGPEDADFQLVVGKTCDRAWEDSFQELPWHRYDDLKKLFE